MNTLALWAPALITVVSVIYGAGAIMGRIKDQETTLAQHNEWLKSHDNRIAKHDVEIAVAAAWRNGYDQGKSAHGRAQ